MKNKGRLFNKRNVRLFANDLYAMDKNGDEHYMPLCHGSLAKANGEVTHCIFGELYEHFTGKPVARALTDSEEEYVNLGLASSFRTTPDHQLAQLVAGEDEVLEALLSRIRRSSECSTIRLRRAIEKVVIINDAVGGNSEDAQINRAKNIQSYLRLEVLPLLK